MSSPPILCNICDAPITNAYLVTCVCCMKMFHAATKSQNCAQITASEEKLIFLRNSTRMVYRCLKCTTEGCYSSPLEKLVEDLNQRLDTLGEELSTVKEYKNKVDTFDREFTSFKQEQDLKDIKINKIEDTVKNLNEVKIPEMKSTLSAAIIKDYKEN